MKICPDCGAEVRDMDVMFHKCASSTENGKSNEEQKIEFVDLLVEFLTEWWVYCIITPSFSGPKHTLFDEKNKFDILKWFWANITTITIPIWLITIFLSPQFVIGRLGIVMGLIALIFPPLLIWIIWYLNFKGKKTYAFLLTVVNVLILIFPFGLFLDVSFN